MARAGKNGKKTRNGADVARVKGTGPAIAGPGTFANTGYLHIDELTVVQRRPPQEPAAWPHLVGGLPPRAQSFQQRAEVEELRAVMDVGDTAVLCQVLTGMGGVGKTQLAADYAHWAWNQGDRDGKGGLDVLVWVTAGSRLTIVDRYAQAGRELCRGDPDDAEEAARAFLAWLMPRSTGRQCRWLVVLDDVADPDDLRGLWPPANPYGRTLVTTRRRDAALTGDGRHLVEVGLFCEDEAVAHLTTSLAARGRTESAAELTELAHDLGRLPLALSQAAAYLVDSGQNAAAYRSLLAHKTTRLTDTTPDRLPDDQAVPLAAAWTLSLERADQLRPVGLARPMFQLAAHLDANGIPRTVLTSEPARTYVARHRTPTDNPSEPPHSRRWWQSKRRPADAPATVQEAVDALRALHRLSLVDHSPGDHYEAVHIHQLVQRASRETLTPDQHDETARIAADALLTAWPDNERDPSLAQALRANTAALITCAEEALYRPDAHPVLYRKGKSLGDAGQAVAATGHYRYLADTASSHLGPEHSAVLAARRDLAWWQKEAGDVAGAAITLAELLSIQERVLGKDHPDTLAVRHSLARWQGRTSDGAHARHSTDP